ncbi:RNA polymerase sigma factor [Aquimarina sp. I32.4]|uniref:RNA polymerase sigma factor n=1 Tax=Aquimarina sp. I32.4 TaxID=2053903 RepID=UPI000CDEB41B|nr:sigma-70 family RNA polymerase sigma factor [Aquimarina sp. I32.4]
MKSNQNILFEEIYQQHHAMVMQMCLGFVRGDHDIAKDLQQEVFISVWKNLKTFRGASSYKTWIYRITVNTCLQHVKKKKKEPTFSISEIENQVPFPEQKTPEKRAISTLYTAIGQLNELDRLLIMMVLDNQDYDTIAEVIGIQPTNVRVKIHRVKKRLKKILENNGNG